MTVVDQVRKSSAGMPCCTSNMKHFVRMTIPLALLAGSAYANTCAWYRFDDKAPGFRFASMDESVIKNEIAGSEKNQPCEVSASTGDFGALNWTTDWYPAYVKPFHGFGVYDPVSKLWKKNNAALDFKTGPNSSGKICNYGGAVRVLKCPAKPTDAITVECFVKTTGGNFNTFAPIAFVRRGSSWTAETWALYLQKDGKLAVRLTVGGTSDILYKDNNYNGASVKPSHVINDGVWHHIALTYSTATGVLRTYVDYGGDLEKTYASKAALTYDTSATDAYNALYVGGSAFWDASGGGRNFTGSVDELRISDTVLETNEFLRLQDDATDDTFRFHTGLGATGKANVGSSTYFMAQSLSETATFAAVEPETCADALRSDMFSDVVANDSSLHFITNGSYKGNSVKIANFANRMFGNANSSFTVELFFKAAGIVGGGDDGRQTLFKFGGTPTAQIYFNASSSRKMHYACNQNGTWTGTTTAAGNLDDGKWHHAAFVYDMPMKQVRIYFDHKQDTVANNIEIRMDTDASLCIGANQDGRLPFGGWVDDVRVSRRALRPTEFLCATAEKVDATNPTLLFANYDNDLASSVNAGLLGAATAEKQGQSTGSLPTYGRPRCVEVALGGSNMSERTANAASIVGKSSRWGWNYSPLFEQDAFTVEFFAKISAVNGNAALVRYAGSDYLYDTGAWMLYSPTDSNASKTKLKFRTRLVANGVSSDDYSFAGTLPWSVTDDRWHHYAFSYEPHEGSNTLVTLWADYQEVGRQVLTGRLDYAAYRGGRLSQGGASDATTHFDGAVDCLRYTKGVLRPEQFIRKVSQGVFIYLR